MTAPRPEPRPDDPDRVVVRDKRKIDRTAAADPEGSAVPETENPAGPDEVAELTAVLQRVQAEYANYRKRAERERLAAGELAIGSVLAELLPVLDDIDRARSHGDLTGALKAVADHLEGIVTKLGVEAFGEVGDPFDPTHHEAVAHDESDEVDGPTATMIMRRGYKHNARLLRPAMVAVSEPSNAQPPTATEDPLTEIEAAAAPDGTDGDETRDD